MAEVFLCKTGALTPASRNALRKAGIVVVEADNPADCQFIRSTEVISSNAMLTAAIKALRTNFDTGYNRNEHNVAAKVMREKFALNVMAAIDAAVASSDGA